MELEQLLSACKQGSITAQKCLFDRFARQMFVVCRRYMRTDADAEERLMSGFLKFFQTAHRIAYVNEPAFVGYLRKLMVNECLMELRRQNSYLQVSTDQVPDAAVEASVLHQLSAADIFQLITQLPTGYRTVFNLYEVEGYSHKEIAAMLQISEGTSKSQLSKARQLLQQLIQQQTDYYATGSQ